MRIAITVDPVIPVPPLQYGGIERIADFLVRNLARRGHQVTLFAHPDSQAPATVVPYGLPPHSGFLCRSAEIWNLGKELWKGRRTFDLIHSFGRLAALVPVLPVRSLPKIQSYQRAVPWNSVEKAVMMAGNSIHFTGCSSSVYRDLPKYGNRGGQWLTIYNGVDIGKYAPVLKVPGDAPLAFLGRLHHTKGVHHAIAIAKGAGRKLIIAGNREMDREGLDYFQQQIEPHLGEQIQYIGPVDDRQKNSLLGSAAGFLMPIEWEEPFGIVMAEAMACGTPVIGFERGSVSEVIRDGINGYRCHTVAEAVRAVQDLQSIDRAAVRADCERRFSDSVVVDAYEHMYARLFPAA